MKNLFKSLVVGALLLGGVGCSDMFKEDLYEINNEIDKINQRIDSLCNAVNTNIASLQTIIDVMQDNDYVDSITPIVEGGETVGYEIVFTQSGSVKIYHGKKGETGATGHTPVVSVKQAEDGRWYWTVDGEYLLDGDGDKILAEAIDGEDGATGADGITPQLKVEGDYWYISYDNKATWERLGKATGEAGKDGDSMFKSVTYNDEYVELVLVDGTVLRIPTWASHMLLVDEIAKINSNISALQAAVEALESNDYVQKVTPVKDNEGNVVGYTLQFAYAGDVTIYHGEDGKDGEDGEDGKDGVDGKDGYTPVISVKLGEDGVWYWTIDNEWMLDPDGNRIRTTGKDGHQGVDGKPGEPGLDGKDGITPEFKIEDDYWYVSYDKGQTWTKLGKAKGEDGAAGSAGSAGDAFFKGVDTSNEYYIILTLANGTEIKIPTWKTYQELEDKINHLMTNVQSLQSIIKAMQENDYITKVEPIIDLQTNEEIGYTFHFYKGGKIDIYHGKDGKAPEIGIKNHPKLGLCWTFNGEYIIDPTTQLPVALPKDGEDGKDGVTPMLKIVNGEWWMSTNGGKTWTSIGQATGDTGAAGGAGDSFFKSIVPEYATDADGNVLKDELGRPIVAYIVMTLAGENEGDEVTYKVPTEYVTSELNKRIAALETQFTAIETIVKAIQNAEYIKSVVEQYDGPALVGYKITFIKYTIENGTLIPSERDVYIGSASNAGSKVEYAKDENGDYYWVIDGSPLKDEDGNILYIEGKTPTVEINKDGYWVINGVNTGVKARGEDGENGENGSNASSLFSDVVLDGSYYVFTFTDGREPIKVPSWKAFEDLQMAVTQLTATVESFTELIQGNKYIEKVEALSENKGYTLFVKEFNADTQTWDTKSYTIYNGTDGSNGATPVVPTISVAQDPENPEDQNYYWKVGDNWLTDAQGNKIRANALDGDPGLDALTPEFRIVNGTLYYKYTNEGDDKWRELANVQGSSAAVNIIFQNPANPLESEWIEIRFGEGENDKIKIPTWVAYEKIQDTISSLTTNVEAISALVYGHKYVESFKELENGGYEFVVRYYDENAKEWKTEVHTIDITTADEIGVKKDETDNNYYWTKGGEWLLDAAGNKVMVDGSAERTLEFKSENDGKLYYKYSDETEWTVLDIAVSESVVDSNVVVKEEDGKVTVTVLDDAGMILYSFSAPSWEAFEALQGRVIALEEQVTDIYTLIAQLTTNYEALSGDVKTMKDKLAKCKFIGEYEYDAERKGNVIYLVDIDGNKLQNAAGEYETIFIADGEDGEDFDASMLSFTEVDGEYFWTYNGEMLVDAAGKPVKAHGADGRTPEFRISNDVLQYRYEGEGDDAWQSLGNVKGSASAANITVENPADPDHSMWIMIQYTYTDAQGNEIVEEVKLPTYYAYEKALDEIAAIESTIEMVETFLKGNKFVSDYELTYDQNGMVSGCTVTTVEYKLQEDGSYRVFTSEAEFNPSQTMSVKLENDVWYLVFYNEKGEEVKRPLSQSAFTFVPEVAVNNGYIYVAKVSEPGNDYADTEKWECLGAVVELLGGETGSAQGALKSVEEIDGYICFTFSNGEVLKVPSDAKFQEVLDRLDAVEERVEDLETVVAVHASSIEGLSALSGNVTQLMQDVATLKTYKFIGTPEKTENGWEIPVINGAGEATGETITLSHGADGTDVTIVQPEGLDDYYWFVNGENTGHKVTGNNGKDGKTPIFRINAETGKLEYQFEGDQDWTVLDKVVGEDGAPGAPGTNGATNVVFASAVEFDEDGAYVSYTAATSADAALWVGVQYGIGETDYIWMPTYMNFQALAGRLELVENAISTIQGKITEINASLANLSDNISKVEGSLDNYLTSADFEEWKEDARFVSNVVKNGDEWTFAVSDGNGDAIDADAFTITVDHPVSTYKKDAKLYWVINGEETEYPVETEPKFRVTQSGDLEFSFDGETWTTLESSSNVVDVKFTNNPYPTDGEIVYLKENDIADAFWVGIYYSEDNIIWMPTYKNFSDLTDRVVALEGNITTINNLLSGKTFVQSVKYVTDENGNKQLIVTSVTVEGSIIDGTAKFGDPVTETLSCAVEPKLENGVWYWYINGQKLCAIDGTFVPVVVLHTDGNIYVSTHKDATRNTIASDLENNNDRWYLVGQVITPSTDKYVTYEDKGTYYEISFPGTSQKPISVPKYYQEPIIGALTKANETGATTVTFTVTGSFVNKNKPEVYAACEGNWSSSVVTVGDLYEKDTKVDCEVTVTPTTAYVQDNSNGKLTVYVPYYGKTAIKQVALSAVGSTGLEINSVSMPMQILSKDADDTEATVFFTLDEEGSLPPSNGSCTVVFDHGYELTGVQTIDGKEVETGNGFNLSTNVEPWLSSAGASSYDSTTHKYTQKITIKENQTETPRTGAVIVYSPSGREVTRFVIKQEAMVVDNTPVINLVETNGNKAANCYIITDPGRYQIDTYMGAYNTDISSRPKCTGKPEVIWNEGGNDITPCQVGFSDNKLIFDVKGTINPGNAIIGIRNPKDANDILWSWHLWFCTPGEDPRLDENTDTYPDVTNVNVMNRALGAVSSDKQGISSYSVEYWKDGLFYQSGRKDPIRLNSSGKAAYDEVSKNSDIEFDKNWTSNGWTSSKSEQDPCPPGYKVPTSSIWRDEASSGLMETISTYSLTDVYPYNVESSNISDAILYPYCGYLNAAGEVNKTHKSNKSQDVYGDGPAETFALQTMFSTINGSSHRSKPSYPAIIVSAIKYDKYDIHSLGYLKATNDNVIEYGYKQEGYSPISYTYKECGWRSNIIGRYSANYNDVKKELVLDANQIKNYLTETQLETLHALIAVDNLSFLQTDTYLEKNTEASNNAYYVRCVKE